MEQARVGGGAGGGGVRGHGGGGGGAGGRGGEGSEEGNKQIPGLLRHYQRAPCHLRQHPDIGEFNLLMNEFSPILLPSWKRGSFSGCSCSPVQSATIKNYFITG